MKKIIAILMSLVLVLSMSACGKQSEKTISENVIASTEEQEVSTDLSDSPEEIIVSEEPTESEEISEEWSFLEGNGGWHQRLTDEHLKNAKYLFDQGLDSALESHCVLLYKDDARDFALYYSFKSYQYDDLEDVLIVSNGKRTVAKGCGAWEKADLRETASACDLDGDGFEEILIRVITGTGTGFFNSAFFVFDSSDDTSYDMLSVCGAEGIVYGEENNEIKYLQDVSVTVDTDGTVLFAQGTDKKYEGHIKGLIGSCPEITKARWRDVVSAELKDDGKLVLVAEPCFWGDEFIMGAFAEPNDEENDVCDIVYEVEYSRDGTFKCVSVDFE